MIEAMLMGGGMAGIKRVQMIEIAGGSTEGTPVSIETVDTERTLILVSTRDVLGDKSRLAYGVLTDENTVTFYSKGLSSGGSGLYVIEFGNGVVKSKQTGISEFSTLSVDVPIETVDMDKTLVMISYTIDSGKDASHISHYLADQNTLSLTSGSSGGSGSNKVAWQVIEFN